MTFLEREEMVLGTKNIELLASKRIIVFGAGGVGGACIETLVRAGITKIDIVDGDTVSVSNKNRQIIALDSTIGKPKAEVIKKRLQDINKNVECNAINLFYITETYDQIDLSKYDFVVDCIDTITAKLHIIEECNKLGIPLICATGTGNRLDPTKFFITDIFKTENDPLCRILRFELRKRKISKLTVLASKEKPFDIPDERKKKDEESGRNIPGSISFVPPVAGMIITSYVIRKLLNIKINN